MAFDLLAAVDMGSNSFRLLIGRVEGEQIYPLDSIKEPVRMAAGLTPQKFLDSDSQQRGLAAISRFAERIRGMKPDRVRIVATNTFRVAKNAADFINRAEKVLGFPIEVVAGREEARLIYLGVAHSLPDAQRRQLVVDIGGGSTEFIIGTGFVPEQLESLYMGCVRFSNVYFGQKLTMENFAHAELAAKRELQTIRQPYLDAGWDLAVGSSGTAKFLTELIQTKDPAATGMTLTDLYRIRQWLIDSKTLDNLDLKGSKRDRIPVLPGGLAIMIAVFETLEITHMEYADGALRLGVLYDLLGRYHHDDMRDATVKAFFQRYLIDARHAQAVTETAVIIYAQLIAADRKARKREKLRDDSSLLMRAAMLHEVGLSIAHTGYHKHGAYIVENADMPGFSRHDQTRMARIILAQRGKLSRVAGLSLNDPDWSLIFSLRVAVILHRAREYRKDFDINCSMNEGSYLINVSGEFAEKFPLTYAAIDDEQSIWTNIGHNLRLETHASETGLN